MGMKVSTVEALQARRKSVFITMETEWHKELLRGLYETLATMFSYILF